jgi:3-phosphoglycerate kinase
MAYTFLKAQGYEIGTSLSQAGQMFKDKNGNEMEITDLAKKLIEKAKEKGVDVSLPVDHVCHTTFGEPEGDNTALVTDDANIPADYMALDFGPKTVELYKSKIRECKSAIWNGPMGVFEMTTYSKGTFSISGVMGDETEINGMLTIVGGGVAQLSSPGMPTEWRIQVPGEAHLWNNSKAKSYQELQSWMTTKEIGTFIFFSASATASNLWIFDFTTYSDINFR